MGLDLALAGVLAALVVVLVLITAGRLLVRANDQALDAYVHTGTTRRTRRAQQEVRPLRRLDLAGELLPAAQDDQALVPYAGGGQLAPYQPGVTRLPSADPGPGWELTRQTPNRQPTVAADFTVPALQAAMTGVTIGIMAGLLAWALAWSWRVPVAICGLAFGLAWLWRLRIVDALLWKIESITHTDLTGDGVAGAPTPAHDFTLANPSEARSAAAADVQQTADDGRKADLLAFVDRCLLVGCSEAAQKINPSDRAEYMRKRDVLFELGIAAWKNPNRPRAGWQIVVSHERARLLIARHVL